MRKRKLLIVLIMLVLAFFFFIKESETSLKDNYYQEINKEILLNNKLEDGEYNWSYFQEAQSSVDEDIEEIVKDIIDGNVNWLDEKEITTIQNVYNKAINMNKRDKDGISALDMYLDKVWDAKEIDELIEVIINIERDLNIDILTNVEIMADYKDNTKNIIYFIPVTFAFGASSDYIIDEDYMTYKAYLRQACVRLWKAYGKDTKEAREVVERVFSFYEEVSKHSKLKGELENISSYYNVIYEQDFLNIYNNVGKKYLIRKGLNDKEFYSIIDKEQYEYLNNSLINDNLLVWKEVVVTKILSSYASYGSSDYLKVVDDLNKALLGDNKEITNEEHAINMVKDLFSEEIDLVYQNKFLDSEVETEIQAMVLEIKEIYKKRLKANDWLSKSAIDKALVKLDKMQVIIGTDIDKYSYNIAKKMTVSNGSLIDDVIKIKKLIWNEELKRLDSGDKKNLVLESVVNAYYQPLDNSIVIPVAFLELVCDKDSYYEKLGTLGMILAHEVIHGFDGNGSQFDEFGNLNNWWSIEDEKSFDKLQKEVSNYYSKYEVLDGKYINGDRTVNENTADLGAVACIVDIALDKGASAKEFKEMFSSFAKIWASNESEEYMELLLLQDVHAPNEFRVNAVLSSNDLFYQVYDIYPWNDMWISKDNRVSVW